MSICRSFRLIASAVVIFAVVGCDQPVQSVERPAPAAVIQKEPQKQAGQNNPDAPTTKELLAYYSGNLSEAKTKWHECLATGLEKVSAEERPRCVAAGNAWHNQPYVPGQGKVK